ncbi:MAG: NAD(P)/FAD-dependent oxidoreductase [Bacteroidota bacterium]
MLKSITNFDLIVIGAGAAGFFGAIQAVEKKPGLSVLILEKTSKLLSKVKVSGGGRCNVTHHCFEPTQLAKHYPRGRKEIKSLFRKFQVKDTVAWFESKNVKLKIEDDGRMFPITDDSQTIVDCFLNEAERNHIRIKLNSEVVRINHGKKGFEVDVGKAEHYYATKILIAAGGYNNLHSYEWIAKTLHLIIPPIPSLFTFNDSEKKFTDLLGIAVAHAEVKIAGTKFCEQGPVLITHWGLSGPAIIKLSAWAADYLHAVHYTFTVLLNWTGNTSEDELKLLFFEMKNKHSKQKVITNPMFNIPQRLWQRLCERSEIPEMKIWAELPQKNINKLMEYLIRCPFHIKGKTTFKEEFVTCGGVDLKSIDLETMESKMMKGLYFAGEVLNIDGETGGFNFQSAWTTAYVAATSIALNH